jgi:hypothetical protein
VFPWPRPKKVAQSSDFCLPGGEHKARSRLLWIDDSGLPSTVATAIALASRAGSVGWRQKTLPKFGTERRRRPGTCRGSRQVASTDSVIADALNAAHIFSKIRSDPIHERAIRRADHPHLDCHRAPIGRDALNLLFSRDLSNGPASAGSSP